MHFNENFAREQAITKSGKERIKFYYPKAKQEECTPKIVPVPPTYSKPCEGINHGSKFAFVGYAAQLMAKTIYFVIHPDERPPLPEEPPHLTSQYEHPDKDLIPRFSRYKK